MEHLRTHVLDWRSRIESTRFEGEPYDPQRRETLPPGPARDRSEGKLRTGVAPSSRRTRNAYPSATVQRVRELLGVGMTMREVSALTGVSVVTIPKMRDRISPYRD